LISILLIVAIGSVSIVYAVHVFLSSMQNVNVQGSVSTKTIPDYPAIDVKFTSAQGTEYIAAVHSGVYSIALPNNNIYGVQIDWTGAFGSPSSCNAGALTLRGDTGTLSLNLTC
jgi:hypothetical protein